MWGIGRSRWFARLCVAAMALVAGIGVAADGSNARAPSSELTSPAGNLSIPDRDGQRAGASRCAEKLKEGGGLSARGLYRRGRDHYESRFLLKYHHGGRAQFVYEASPDNVGGPIVAIAVDGEAAWTIGTSKLSQAPVGELVGPMTDEEKTRLMLQRDLVGIFLGLCPDALEQDGLVRFGSRESDRGPAPNRVRIAVSDRGGDFGTLVRDPKTGMAESFEMRFVMLFGRPTEAVRLTNYGSRRLVEGVMMPSVISQGPTPDRLQIGSVEFGTPITPDAFREPATPQEIRRLEREIAAP